MRYFMYVLYGLAGLALLAGALAYYALWVPGQSRQGALPALSDTERDLAARLKAHIVAIASEPHNVGTPAALERSAVAVEQAFAAAGFTVARQQYDVGGVAVRNIWVTVEPSGPVRDTLVIGGHYDSVHDCPGAGDNGSGTAATIELARLLKDLKPKHTRLYFVAFVNEEAPYWGSHDQGAQRFVELLLERGENVRGMLSLETIGWFSDKPGSQKYPAPFSYIYPDVGNFLAFVGMPGSRSWLHEVIAPFRRHVEVPTIGGIAPSFIPGIAWSDHMPFAKKGIPALMLTDTAPFRYPHYHKPTDTPDKVDVATLARITLALDKTLRQIAD